MPQFDPESGERCERVDDQPTSIAGDVIALLGIRLRLNRTVDTDRMSDPLVLAPSVGLTSLGAGRRVAKRTASERLLHHSPSTLASRAAVHPRWKTASCIIESNALPLGS